MVTVREAERPAALGRYGPAIDVAGAGAAAIFLHAGWRSCGTWLWETLRACDSVRAYYEPLHEDLVRLDRAALARFSPSSWASGHSPGAPYFAEYMPRLRQGVFGNRPGIQGYEPRFAFDDFFRDAESDDIALQTYVQGLLDAARDEGRLPVLKFCRSLGRVPWMVRHFPDALHAVVLRDPIPQWSSARRQMEQAKNHYFVVAPFVILARNASHPLLADALSRLRVKLPPLVAHDLGVMRQVCWHHVQGLSWAERYRGFLALWAASAVAALRADVTVIDSESLGDGTPHGQDVERTLGRAAGLNLSLFRGYRPGAAAAWVGSDAEAEDAAQAAFAALDFVAAARATLPAAHARLLARKLTPPFPVVRAAPPPPVRGPTVFAWADAIAYVTLARLTYPLRRAHFYIRGWLSNKNN